MLCNHLGGTAETGKNLRKRPSSIMGVEDIIIQDESAQKRHICQIVCIHICTGHIEIEQAADHPILVYADIGETFISLKDAVRKLPIDGQQLVSDPFILCHKLRSQRRFPQFPQISGQGIQILLLVIHAIGNIVGS